MLGNDVIDLADGETRPEAIHPRFDERVFAVTERAELAKSSSPERLRWKLWAAKESAYKAAKKLDPRTIFSPVRFVVNLVAPDRATVRAPGRSFSVSFHEVENAVHAVALEKRAPRGSLVSGLRRFACEKALPQGPDAASAAARRLVIETLSERFGIPAGEIVITSSEDGVPRLWLRGDPAEISLSHHGRFVAFAAQPLSCTAR